MGFSEVSGSGVAKVTMGRHNLGRVMLHNEHGFGCANDTIFLQYDFYKRL